MGMPTEPDGWSNETGQHKPWVQKYGDAEDWALTRILELRETGEQAKFRLCKVRYGVWTVIVVRANGRIEHPPFHKPQKG